MIYIHFVELLSLMLHAKFQNHRLSGSGVKIFKIMFLLFISMAATLAIYINFHSPFLRMLHMKFGFDWPSRFRREDL